MMNARLNKALVALLAVAAAGACDDAPVDVRSADADRLITNPSFVVIEAGETRLVQAYLANALGNPVSGDVDFEACNSAITVAPDENQTDIEPGSNFTITGNTLGSSCVNVSGSGHERTVQVRVVPAELELTVVDTILSGETAPGSVVFIDALGGTATGFDLDEVSFESLDTLIATVDAEGNVTAKAPGEVEIVVTLDEELGADRADTVTAVVVPGEFAGTMDPGTAGVNDTVTFTAGAIPFDDDTRAFFGEEEAVVVSADATTLVAIVPEGAEGEFLFTNMGPGQVSLAGEYTAGADAELLVVSGATFAGKFSGDDADDTFFVTVPADGTFDVSIAFTEDSDIDAYMTQDFVLNFCSDDFFACSTATGDNPETVTTTLPAGDYEILIFLYDAHGNEITDYTITFE